MAFYRGRVQSIRLRNEIIGTLRTLPAIGLPTLLHGTYNAFGGSVAAILIALASVVALTLYFAKSVDFEKLLAQRKVD